MSGYLPLIAAIAVVVAAFIKNDLLTTVIGFLAAVMFLCTSAIVFAINNPRNRRR